MALAQLLPSHNASSSVASEVTALVSLMYLTNVAICLLSLWWLALGIA